MKTTLALIFALLLPLTAPAFSLGELWVGQFDSFPMGACDDERGWFALRSWTAEIDIVLGPGESGRYVLEYRESLTEGRWHELNNNPDIGFPPYASFNGQIVLPGPGTWTFVFPSPPLETIFFRLKKIA